MLFEYQEMSLADIAAVCEMDVGTVKSRLHRARERLRRTLRAVPGGPPGAAGAGRKGDETMTRDERDPERDEELAPPARAVERPRGAGRAWTSACSPPIAARREAAEPWWSRLFTASVRVPLPVAVGVLMLLIVTAALALRPDAGAAHRGDDRAVGARPGGAPRPTPRSSPRTSLAGFQPVTEVTATVVTDQAETRQ